jgi:hypothetical protein
MGFDESYNFAFVFQSHVLGYALECLLHLFECKHCGICHDDATLLFDKDNLIALIALHSAMFISYQGV